MMHEARRPVWLCEVCDEPWPCAEARVELAKVHSRTIVTVLMWAYFLMAAEDMPTMPAKPLHDQFIRWTWVAWPPV